MQLAHTENYYGQCEFMKDSTYSFKRLSVDIVTLHRLQMCSAKLFHLNTLSVWGVEQIVNFH
jgi:hypothetical protein